MPADRSNGNKKASSSRNVLPYTETNGYTGTPLSARAILFAPNVTPGTYLETEAGAGPSLEYASQSNALLPSTSQLVPTPSRRRKPSGKRHSEGHIPRPPNAFILFRSAFTKTKHLLELESTQQENLSLSKIIGNYWQALHPEEKQVWEEKARVEKEKHAEKYPDYQFRPVHNKEKKTTKRKAKAGRLMEEERRCDEVAPLLLEGKRSDELVAALLRVDTERQRIASKIPESFVGLEERAPPAPVHQPAPYHGGHRRVSSAPVASHRYNPIRLPTLPFLLPSVPPTGSPSPSWVGNISCATRNIAARRTSSVRPTPRPSWTYMQPPLHMPVPAPMAPTWQRDWASIPEPDATLFEPAYAQGGSPFSQAPQDYAFQASPPMQRQRLLLEIDPLNCGLLGVENYSDLPPSALSSVPNLLSAFPFHAPFATGQLDAANTDDNHGWIPTSGSTLGISASPAPSEHALAYALNAGLLAQQLEMQAQEQPLDSWMLQGPMVEPPQQQYDLGGGNDFGAQLQLQQYAHVGHAAPAYSTVVQPSELQDYAPMATHVDDYARTQMGEPSGSGSGSQQGWYPDEAQLGGYKGPYAGGVFEDIFGLGEGAQAHIY